MSELFALALYPEDRPYSNNESDLFYFAVAVLVGALGLAMRH